MSVSQTILSTLIRGSRLPQAAQEPHAGFDLTAQKQTRLQALAMALSVAALWFALHPYRGIVHDGQLYTVQSLNALHPEQFASDLYFRYGSQDAFTIFSLLYKPLVAAFGVSPAHHLATLAGEAALLSGLIFFVRTVFRDRREALFALVAAIAVQSGYGGLDIFHYDEAFATPRPFAEALVLAAFTMAFTGRPIYACLALTLAAALHPVMALTGIAGLGLWVALKDRRLFLLAGAAAGFGVLLGVCSVQPFARLFEVFDPAWLDVVRQRCSFGFLTRWTVADYLGVAASLGLAVACLQWKDQTLRSLALVCSIASLGAMALTLIGGDVGHDVLVVNMQPWRALWLSRLLANMILGILALRARPGGLARWMLLVAATLSALTRFAFCLPIIADFATIAALVLFWIENSSEQPVHPWVRRVFLTLFGIAASSPAVFAWFLSARPGIAGDGVLVIIGAASFGLLVALDRGRLPGAQATVAAGLTLGAALLLNDRRTDWQRFLEHPGASDDLVKFVGEDSNLYWDNNPGIFWFKMGRASFYSCLQGAGAMFYRGTAIDYARRGHTLAKLNTHDFQDTSEDICFQKASPQLDGPNSIEDIRQTCRALPELDGVVLEVSVPGVSPEVWTSPAARVYFRYPNTESSEAFYKYTCHDLR